MLLPKTHFIIILVVAVGMLSVVCVDASDRAVDEYVATAQNECFSSKRIMSCFRYKAARYLWSAANGRLNFFEPDNSRTLGKDAAATSRGSFHFVQLSEPSTEVLFPEARQQAGAPSSTWLFFKRSLAAFLNAHGFRFSMDEGRGARILTVDEASEDNASSAREVEGRLKKKKWQVIVPLAILGKLMHLKMMVMQILFGLGAIQAILIGGGVLLYYYLKHNTLCRIEPHLVQTHSHVVEASLPEISHSSYSAYPNWGGPLDSTSATASHPYGGHYSSGPSYASPGAAPTYHKAWDRSYGGGGSHHGVDDVISHH